jgi:hypothetical protein
MARKKVKEATGYALFDVTYDDGTLSSNRRIALSEINDYDGEAGIRAALEAQDRKIAEASGRSRGEIKKIVKSASR